MIFLIGLEYLNIVGDIHSRSKVSRKLRTSEQTEPFSATLKDSNKDMNDNVYLTLLLYSGFIFWFLLELEGSYGVLFHLIVK